jgi:hypothetical protein
MNSKKKNSNKERKSLYIRLLSGSKPYRQSYGSRSIFMDHGILRHIVITKISKSRPKEPVRKVVCSIRPLFSIAQSTVAAVTITLPGD